MDQSASLGYFLTPLICLAFSPPLVRIYRLWDA
ncbi:hypothetical protein F383_31087 [Gossypium arboreum]|uniref:Uncharacterized protein n=1 Tax=Gossypium arboreum TaxID=29729 RepID=A0A0B0N0S8_GOSAR|nr:hypothetical protein F383_31087 [Gossypium arboreum]